MKIIHCADLHLDSRMETNLDKERAKERKAELLNTFQRMVSFAAEQQVKAILIAGDLFDKRTVSQTARNIVCQTIQFHPEIDFYYLKGNHDEGDFSAFMNEIPDNLKLFTDTWTTYVVGEVAGRTVTVSGMENGTADTLCLHPEDINIVMLHGQECLYQAEEKSLCINLGELRNKGIDYLALGHIHAYKEEPLDSRGVYCYSGCLEGRGFDECGEHGFVLLTIAEDTAEVKRERILFASRNFYTLDIPVTDCKTTLELQNRITMVLEDADLSSKSLVKLVLTGEWDIENEKDLVYLHKQFESQFYFLKIYDETKLKVDYQSFAMDESLKGEFVRTVQAHTELSEAEQAELIRYGIQALAGEGEWK